VDDAAEGRGETEIAQEDVAPLVASPFSLRSLPPDPLIFVFVAGVSFRGFIPKAVIGQRIMDVSNSLQVRKLPTREQIVQSYSEGMKIALLVLRL